MHKSATKCNKTLSKWCKNKHGVSKIIDMLEMYQGPGPGHQLAGEGAGGKKRSCGGLAAVAQE
jgi:hypothetical protein